MRRTGTTVGAASAEEAVSAPKYYNRLVGAATPSGSPYLTDGHIILLEWVRQRPWERTQSSIAKYCGVTRAAVSLWLTAGVVPGPLSRDRLLKLAGINQLAWRSDDERKLMSRLDGRT